MTPYAAPTADMRFIMDELGLLPAVSALPKFAEATTDLRDALLEEAAKLAGEVLAPINHTGDLQGATLENGVVRTADGFKEAYKTYVEGGWNTMPFTPDYGGQGLPWLLTFATAEMWVSANNSWSLCPMLTVGAIDALTHHGADDLKNTYLEKLISGEWTGTMNLTEPQAGSDVGALRCRAEPEGDHYRIKGQKIFITWGEHDMADNIVHLVLARTPDAPEGTRGISLFVVPKFMVKEDGSLGERNDLRCVSLEHKLGIHASPTCVMSYGDNEGAIGYLVGEENRGLNYMFTMMNNARLNVGLSGISIAERAYQQAVDYAKQRVQGVGLDGQPAAIIRHPDVRRMLLWMRSTTEAMRAFIYDVVMSLDLARNETDPEKQKVAQARVDLLTPVAKAWCTDMGVEIASMGIQVHGGMGYMEETGAVQHLRDARIAPIYEGTNGIQAQDLVMRKVLRDGGQATLAYGQEVQAIIAQLAGDGAEGSLKTHLTAGLQALETATKWLLGQAQDKRLDVSLAAATPYLRLFGLVGGGAVMARAAMAANKALAAGTGDADFYKTKLLSSQFYAENTLSQAPGLVAPICNANLPVLDYPEERF